MSAFDSITDIEMMHNKTAVMQIVEMDKDVQDSLGKWEYFENDLESK